MRLICPNCDAEYEVDASAIPDSGRDVQCSNCGHAWFQQHPEIEAEQSAESAVYDPPPPMASYRPQAQVTDAETIPDRDLSRQADPSDPESILDAMGLDRVAADDFAADGASLPDLPPRHELDPDAMQILREEVARETAQRQVEQGAPQPRPDVAPVVARRVARLKGIQPPPTQTAAQTPTQTTAQSTAARDRLPRVDEVNSKLRGGDAARAVPKRKIGARLGFWLMLIMAALAGIAYAYAPEIAQKFPQTEPYLARYLPLVDGWRDQLDVLLPKVIARAIDYFLIAKDWTQSMIATLTQIIQGWL